MKNILNRIQRLQDRVKAAIKPLVNLTYGNGMERQLRWMDAFMEIGRGADVVAVSYPDKTGESLLAAMLPGVDNEVLGEIEETE